MAATGWKRRFDEPIKLPGGGKLVSLKDAIAWLTKENPEVRARDETSSSRRALRHRGRGEWRADDVRSDRHDAGDQEPCSLARTIAVIGDRWTLSILRECFLRTRRFEGFQSTLGITRHLLSQRLKKLVRNGVLRRIPYQESPKRYEYILTQKGLDLYPIMMALVHWGDTHLVDERGPPLLHEHRECGKLFNPVMVCSECGEPVIAKDVVTHPGPSARRAAARLEPEKPPHANAKAPIQTA